MPAGDGGSMRCFGVGHAQLCYPGTTRRRYQPETECLAGIGPSVTRGHGRSVTGLRGLCALL
jgi:hypothetical protein